MFSIPADHKYATLALEVIRPTFHFTDALELEPGMFVARELPHAVPAHWREWLGSIRVDDLSKANLFLFAHSSSATPRILDADNKALSDFIHRLYFGLLIAVPYIQPAPRRYAHDRGASRRSG